jgi:hypothetical protein
MLSLIQEEKIFVGDAIIENNSTTLTFDILD